MQDQARVMPQFSVLENREQLCMQSQPVSRSKKTEYDIFFRIVKEQPTHSTRNDAQANSGEVRLRIAPGVLSPPLANESGGGERDRTDDPLLAKQVLSQLSYTPV